MTNFHSRLSPNKFTVSAYGRQTGLYRLKNSNGIELSVTDFGARIIDLWTPDRNGVFEDIVLGHDNIQSYIDYKKERFFGATVGRFGNRIKKGKFTIDGMDYQLRLNDGENSLHGGFRGFDMVIWTVTELDKDRITMKYISLDGEEGFPGRIETYVSYLLTDNNELRITFKANTDKKTILNLTHHSFFNLHGAGNGTIEDHLLTINASKYIPVDNQLIPTGEIASVENTPMDFRIPCKIGNRIDIPHTQLIAGHGYDHNWVLDRKTASAIEFAAELHDPVSGRSIEVWTTYPGLQFYSGNFLNGESGKYGKHYTFRSAVALETQYFPDSPNHSNFSSAILRPEDTYYNECIYRFTAK